MWVLVITRVDFISYLWEKKLQLASGGIKAGHSHYTGIKADPLSFKRSLSIPLLKPIVLTPTFSVHADLMISSAVLV